MTRPTRSGRSAKVKARTDAPVLYKPALNRAVGPVNLLDEEGIQHIHRAVLHIVETIGVDFRDPVALADWTRAGARVEGTRVRLDRAQLMELIGQVPGGYRFNARNPERSVDVGGDSSIFANCYGAPFVYGLDGVRRRSELEDSRNFFRLAQMSACMHVPGILPVEPQDVPVPQRHLDLVSSALRLTDKPIMGSVVSEAAARDTVKMLRIVFGEDYLERNVVVTSLLNGNSPLVWDETMLQSLRVYASANQPALLTPFLLAGASAPASITGGVAQLLAEALAGIAYAQVVRKGCPMVLGVALLGVSMKTGAPMLGTAEPGLMNLVVGQMARFYGLPWRSCTMWSGSKSADLQAGYDSANAMWPVLLGGCNFIVHSAGIMEGTLGVSYAKWVQDAAQLDGFYRFFEGLKAENMNAILGDIAAIGPGGHFLGTDHTRENPFVVNPLQNNDSYEQWLEDGAKTAETVGNETARRMLDRFEAPAMDGGISEALERFVADRRRALGGVSG